MDMHAYSSLFHMRDIEKYAQNCTAMCPCVFNGHDAVAVFAGLALHVHYSSKEAPDTRVVSHIAGMSEAGGSQDGPGWLARFRGVNDMTYFAATDKLIVCDSIGRTVRSVHLKSPFAVSTLCGHTTMSGEYLDGSMRQSLFDSPYNVCIAPNGVDMYVSDYGNHAVRKIDTLHARVNSIFGGGAPISYAGAAVDMLKCMLMYPMGLKMAPNGKHLYVVNFGCNSICEVQIDPGNGKGARLVRGFALHTAKHALPTVIDVTPCGHVIVWRQNCVLEVDDVPAPDLCLDRASTMALYDPRDGQILFKMQTAYTPGAFFMRFASNHNAVNGTVIHALKRNRAGISKTMLRISLTLNEQVMKLLLRDMQKKDTRHLQEGAKVSAFSLIPLSILQYIIEMVNNPFCVAVHP